jgi:hypothetical protein
MTVFYVLPPRPALGQCLAGFLRAFVPGMAISSYSCGEMIESLLTEAANTEQAYVIYREDIPEGLNVNQALRDGFGAELGDRVILVSLGVKPHEPRIRFEQLDDAPEALAFPVAETH